MKTYKVRVFIPTVYVIEADNVQEASRKAVAFFKQEDKQVMLAFLSNSWKNPEVEVEVY
jgi:hypothetical protein